METRTGVSVRNFERKEEEGMEEGRGRREG